MTSWEYWVTFFALNAVIYGVGSWWIFTRLVGPPVQQSPVRQDDN
jgi:hypothetical protein